MRRTGIIAGALTLGALALYVATIEHHFPSPDEYTRFSFAYELGTRGLAAFPGSGALCRYPPLQSMWAALFIAPALGADPTPSLTTALEAGAFATSMAAALCIGLAYVLLRAMRKPALPSAVACVLFAMAGPIWPYAKRFYSEPLSALLVLVAAYAIVVARTSPRRGAVLWAIAMVGLGLNVPAAAAVVGAGGVGVLILLKRFRDARNALFGGVLGVVVMLAMQKLRFGQLNSGYGGETFTFELADGIPGLLWSPGRSIFLYAPLLILAVPAAVIALKRGARDIAGFALAVLVGQVALISAWWSWHGGQCWGPRLVTAVLPLVSLFVVDVMRARWQQVLVGVAAAFGIYVQVLGITLSHEYDQYLWMAADGSDERRSFFEWDYTQLARVPGDIRLSPWDASFALLRRDPKDETIVLGDGRALQSVRLEQRGQSVLHPWAISDIVAEMPDGSMRRGSSLHATVAVRAGYGMNPGTEGAVDDSAATAWRSGAFRRPGMAIRVDFAEPIAFKRLRVVHAPHLDEFPSHVLVEGRAPGAPARPLQVIDGTPALHFAPAFYALLALAALAFTSAVLVAGRSRRALHASNAGLAPAT